MLNLIKNIELVIKEHFLIILNNYANYIKIIYFMLI